MKRRAFYQQFEGQERPVLFEQHKDSSLLSGFTDNYVKIEIPADAADVNTIFPVRLGALNGDGERVLASIEMLQILKNAALSK